MIWFIGDSVIGEAVQEFAGEEELVSTATSGATQEEVWTMQKSYGRRRWAEPPTVICYIDLLDYDSEATLWHILSAVPKGSKILYLYLLGGNIREGLDHYDNPLLLPLEITSTDKAEVLEALNESR